MSAINETISNGLDKIFHRPSSSEAESHSPNAVAGQPKPGVNVGETERNVSLAAGAVLAVLGLVRRDLVGLAIAGVGGALVYRGATGNCPLYRALDTNTSTSEERARHGVHVEQAFLINRSPQDLYDYWRNFENLPNIMSHLKSVEVLDARRSRWVATAPRIAGGSVEWQAEITRDEPGRLIGWQSLEGSEVDTRGEISFSPAMGDRGTEVRVSMKYNPPAGRLGKWIATLVGEGPQRQIREDLRNFKRLMEAGEIPTVIGQPRGTCNGRGKYEG